MRLFRHKTGTIAMEQTSLKNLLDDLERRVRALRGYL